MKITAEPHRELEASLPYTFVPLRDQFAMHIIQGICASGPSRDWSNTQLAKEAYELADELIKEREKTK